MEVQFKSMERNTGILERYSNVLETLADAPNGLSLSEIVNQTKIPQGTAHRWRYSRQGTDYRSGVRCRQTGTYTL